MVTVPHEMVRLERMSDYGGVGLQRFYCNSVNDIHSCIALSGQVCVHLSAPRLVDNFVYSFQEKWAGLWKAEHLYCVTNKYSLLACNNNYCI